jgi:hypothetical protein
MEIFDDQYSRGNEASESRYRKFGELEVHEDLIEAQKKDNLVVFAGAGVSAASPSDLPTFEGLVSILEGWSNCWRERETIKGEEGEEDRPVEPFEQYLGRLEDQEGVDFRPKVREEIAREDSEPTDLHRYLLQLFDSPEDARIVTTNFDLHFSRVAPEGVDKYKAPALPRGDDFSGIVYLHGNLSQEDRRLVLSDKDFSRAYLTEGWARRFLQQLFSEYVVLFVGYGHGDDVMRYLARGIPQDRDEGRFAFEIEGDDSVNWEHYGVEISRFPEADREENPYDELPRGIQEWIDRTTRLPSERDARIESILQKEPDTLSRPEREELDSVLTKADQIHFFTKHASSLEWVEWMRREGYLDPLLEPGDVSHIDEQLASWLAGQITLEPDRLLAHLTGGLRRWNSVLTDRVIAALHSDWREELESKTVAKWIRVVLQNAGKSPPSHLSSMLRSCEDPQDQGLAVQLFEYLTRPEVNVRTGVPFMPEEGGTTTSIEVRFSGGQNPPSTTFVREAWKDFFLPNLEDLAPEVASILTERLRDFHAAYAEHRGDGNLDPLTRQWERIRFDEQERITDERFVLPAFGRELMDRLLQEMPERADNLIDRWAHSSVPVLEVLATYGIGTDSRRTADEKIQWVLDTGWLLSRRTSGEPGRVIIEAYSESSVDIREKLLEQIRERTQEFEAAERAGRLRTIRKLLANLVRKTPDDEKVRSQLEELDVSHPDLKGQSGSSELATEDQTQVLSEALDPEDDLETIRDLFSGETEPWARHELERQLERILHNKPRWGIEVGRHLASNEAWGDATWPFLLRIYRRIDLGEDEWEEFFDLCHTNDPLHERYAEEILLTAIYAVDHPDRSFPEALLDDVIALVDSLWSLPEYDNYEGEKSREDWFRNHTHTKTVRFYYRIFVRQANQRVVPESFRSRVEEMLEDGSAPVPSITAFALARRAAQLFDRDRDWGRERIVPLFSWTDDDMGLAVAAWTGAVSLRQLSGALIQELRADFVATFDHMEEWLDSSSRKELAQMVARICAYGVIDPLEEDWLVSYTDAASTEERVSWARGTASFLKDHLSDDQVEHAWQEWIQDYIQQRCSGIPEPFQPEEGLQVMRWIPHLGAHYPTGVEQIRECDPPATPDLPADFTLQIERNDLASEHPEATLEFIDYLLERGLISCWGLPEILPVLAQQDVSGNELDDLFEEAISKGCVERGFKNQHLGA